MAESVRELEEQFLALESRVDKALAMIAGLRHEKDELRARLAAVERQKQQAVQRLDALLDRIEELT